MPLRTILVTNGNERNNQLETDISSQTIKTAESGKIGPASAKTEERGILRTSDTMESIWNHKTGVDTEADSSMGGRDNSGKDGYKRNWKNSGNKISSEDNTTGQSDMVRMQDLGKDLQKGYMRNKERTTLDDFAVKKKIQTNKNKNVDMPNSKNLGKTDDAKAGHRLPPNMKGLKKCIHVMLFLFIFGNDFVDFVSDWLFFADVVIAEKGIVYGPPDRAAVWCLLLFSIIGTFTFLFECVNLWWEFFRNNPWIDSDWLSAIVIWIEDIPQVLISMYLALCREEPISVFQLTKAAVVLFGVVVRIIVTSVKYCNKEAVRSHHHVKIKAVIMLGVILEAFTAAAIFFLTQTERGSSGEVTFRVPVTMMEETYSDQRYFSNVSIFFHDAEYFDVGNLDPNKTDYVVNWLRLTYVSDLRQSSHAAPTFRIDHGYTSSSIMNLAVSEKRDAGNWTLSECYEINIINNTFTDIINTTCLQNITPANFTSIFISLWYEKPGSVFKKKVFGDIHMDLHKQQGGNCSAITRWEDTVESSVNNKVPLTVHYYRTSNTLDYSDSKHLLYQSGVPGFYRNIDSNLLDTRVIWKTGWNECGCNGNFAPVPDTDQSLTCS